MRALDKVLQQGMRNRLSYLEGGDCWTTRSPKTTRALKCLCGNDMEGNVFYWGWSYGNVNTAKGTLKGLYHFRRVYIWDKKSNHVSPRLLIIRKSLKGRKPEIKYALSNASLVQYQEQAVAYMQVQRFFIEHSFQEAKLVLGLNQFQTRNGWLGIIRWLWICCYFFLY